MGLGGVAGGTPTGDVLVEDVIFGGSVFQELLRLGIYNQDLPLEANAPVSGALLKEEEFLGSGCSRFLS